MECDYMKTINAVSLFSGAGGMDVGFEKTGVNVHCRKMGIKMSRQPVF